LEAPMDQRNTTWTREKDASSGEPLDAVRD
jgi:hypothetical protein